MDSEDEDSQASQENDENSSPNVEISQTGAENSPVKLPAKVKIVDTESKVVDEEDESDEEAGDSPVKPPAKAHTIVMNPNKKFKMAKIVDYEPSDTEEEAEVPAEIEMPPKRRNSPVKPPKASKSENSKAKVAKTASKAANVAAKAEKRSKSEDEWDLNESQDSSSNESKPSSRKTYKRRKNPKKDEWISREHSKMIVSQVIENIKIH